MTSSWMTSAKSSYLKQMHSMEPVVSSRVNVAIFVPRFVSFVATFEIMPTNTPFLISLVLLGQSHAHVVAWSYGAMRALVGSAAGGRAT